MERKKLIFVLNDPFQRSVNRKCGEKIVVTLPFMGRRNTMLNFVTSEGHVQGKRSQIVA